MSIEFQISRAILDWVAAQQVPKKNVDMLAQELSRTEKERARFLQGFITPTQAEKLAKMADIPFGFLFLDKPPQLQSPALPDFRTTQDAVPLSRNFFDTLADIQTKVDWYREYLANIGALPEYLPFVGKFPLQNNPSVEAVIADMRSTLKVSNAAEWRNKGGNSSYFSHLYKQLESVGILVFNNGVVKNNNNRPLDVHEFRGFAIADKQVPVIFVNNADAKSAQLFTLLHEATHIWIGESAISNPSPKEEQQAERFCNRVAAEFLVPGEMLQHEWGKNDEADRLDKLASYFCVSKQVIAIKAVQLGLMSPSGWLELREAELRGKRENSGGGGNFYRVLPIRNSKRLTDAVVCAAMNNQLLLRDAGHLLNIQPATVLSLYREGSH